MKEKVIDMYKMIVIDIDDTLITNEGVVTEETAQAIREAEDQGVKVVLATGRMFASAKKVADTIGIQTPIISYQGGYIMDWVNDTVLYEKSIPSDVIKSVINFCEEQNYHLQIYSHDKLYGKVENEKIKFYSEMHGIPFYIEELTHFIDQPVTKMIIFEDPEHIDRVAEELNAGERDDCYITKSKPYFLEILHKEVNKGAAVEFLANYYGIDLEDVITIGDSWNDIPLLSVAGLPVAMGNATEELKKMAKYVTASNNENGVQEVIEKFILTEK